MKKTQVNKPEKQTQQTLNEKTNEDFNRMKPDPKDPVKKKQPLTPEEEKAAEESR